jgi:uncharacterized protein
MTTHVHEVTFPNYVDGITIAGTLSLPDKKGPFLSVLLVSGMGPNDRDYTMLGHKLFLDLSNYLTRAGIAVLRVDKRGVGASTGTFDATVTSQDLSRDVEAGIAYLKTRKEIDSKRIGLIGHSEGGMIAARVASQSPDVAFLVMMAGVFTTSIEHVIEQVSMQLKADGASDALIAHDAIVRKKLLTVAKTEPDTDKAAEAMREIMAEYFAQLPKDQKAEAEKIVFAIKESKAEMMIAFFSSPSYRYWLGYEPVTALSRIGQPVLAINGDLDFVTVSKIQLPIISNALNVAGNTDVTIKDMPGMNHWLQQCSTGAMAEYGSLKESIAPAAMQLMADWINTRFSDKN